MAVLILIHAFRKEALHCVVHLLSYICFIVGQHRWLKNQLLFTDIFQYRVIYCVVYLQSLCFIFWIKHLQLIGIRMNNATFLNK